MTQVMFDLNEVKEKISQGQSLLLAGDEDLLKQLPAGKWIGGTIPYFMAEKGGVCTKEKIFVTKLPDYVVDTKIQVYDEETISRVYTDAPENGFTFILLPASSQIHFSFALNAPNYEEFATRPLVGWISGVYLDDLGKIAPKVFDGTTAAVLDNRAVTMHVALPDSKYCDLKLINIFKQGSGDEIIFPEDGFSATMCEVNGEKRNFAEYVLEQKLDIKLPLVADYSGAMINISFQSVDEADKKVNFYAPVFKGVKYRQAGNIGDYVTQFISKIPEEGITKIVFSCNCILNYLYSELEGKVTGGITGPMTFGEVAYQLLNQTMTYLTISDL